MIIEMLDEAAASGARYGEACRVVGLAPTTVARWRSDSDRQDGRKGPSTPPPNALSAEERAEVVAVMNAPENSSRSPATLVPHLASLGLYFASESTFYRIARTLKLLTARGRARRRTHRRPREAVAKGPNQVWSWDITFLPTTVRGRFFKLYLVIDVWSRMIVAAAVHEVEDDALAALMIESACREQGIRPDQLLLHSDNGGAMKGSTMLAKLQQLGVMASFSRPRVSDDNPFAEALMRTVKYCPAYPDGPFADLASARSWVASFVAWYNEEHLHSGIGFVTPSHRHHGLDVAILQHRHAVYLRARTRHPERWTGKTRSWERPDTVILNPSQTSTKAAVHVR
jgi:putative transposase